MKGDPLHEDELRSQCGRAVQRFLAGSTGGAVQRRPPPAAVHGPGRQARRSPRDPEEGRRVGGRRACPPALVHGEGRAAQGAAQLHAVGARRQSRSTTSTSAPAARTSARVPPARTLSTRRPWNGGPTPRPTCRWWLAWWMPCRTSTSASRWARWTMCISTWARSTSLPGCSPTPASPSWPGPMTSSIRPGSTRSRWPRRAGRPRSSSGPPTSTTASRCRRWSAPSRRSTS